MLIIHPGFEKTGTTTLQEAVFGPHPQILNLGRPVQPLGKQFGTLLRTPDGKYDDAAFSRLADRIKLSDKIAVLSDEHLPKNFYMRGTIARRLAQHFPETQVVFTIRNQISAIESYYGNHGRILKNVPLPFDGKFVTIENWLEYSWKNWLTSFLGLCDYRQTITLYRDLFGEDCINILLFEELRDDLPSFASSLANILLMDKAIILDMLTGTVANARDPARSVIYSRWREKLLPQTSLTKILPFGLKLRNQFHQILNRGQSFQRAIPDTWVERLTAAYAPGNRELEKAFGLPLSKHGYPCD